MVATRGRCAGTATVPVDEAISLGEPRQVSLLKFLMDRLDEDVALILGDTPVFGIEVNDALFEHRFLSRSGLLQRTRTEQAQVALVAEAMQAEQGAPPEAAVDFVPGPVTVLGSQLLKLLATRYAEHPEYEKDWAPDAGIPRR